MKIILAGDSLTEGMNVNEHFTGNMVINKGVYGDNLEGLYARLEHDVIEQDPDLLFILIGTNDLALGRSNTEILSSFKKMINKLASSLPCAEIYITSLLPTRNIDNRPNERIDDLNRHIEVLAMEANFGFLSLNGLFKDQEGNLCAATTTDGLHLSEAGYRRWAGVLREYFAFHEDKRKRIALSR